MFIWTQIVVSGINTPDDGPSSVCPSSSFPCSQCISMSQPLLKLPLLLAVALGMNAGLTPPRVPTHDERKTFDDGAREAVSGVGTWGPRLIKVSSVLGLPLTY